MGSRSELLTAAQSLCNHFACKSSNNVILSYFSRDAKTSVFEHGEPFLAPFLGRKFLGIAGVQLYFELLAKHLTYENMRFSDYVVDVDEGKVAVKGQAEFTWKSTGEKWEETFAYVLDFDDNAKIVSYQVWADSGAAYLARIGELHQHQKDLTLTP